MKYAAVLAVFMYYGKVPFTLLVIFLYSLCSSNLLWKCTVVTVLFYTKMQEFLPWLSINRVLKDSLNCKHTDGQRALFKPLYNLNVALLSPVNWHPLCSIFVCTSDQKVLFESWQNWSSIEERAIKLHFWNFARSWLPDTVIFRVYSSDTASL